MFYIKCRALYDDSDSITDLSRTFGVLKLKNSIVICIEDFYLEIIISRLHGILVKQVICNQSQLTGVRSMHECFIVPLFKEKLCMSNIFELQVGQVRINKKINTYDLKLHFNE